MLIECKEVDGELYVPLKTVGDIMQSVWPFPTTPLPNDYREPKYNPANEEDAPW